MSARLAKPDRPDNYLDPVWTKLMTLLLFDYLNLPTDHNTNSYQFNVSSKYADSKRLAVALIMYFYELLIFKNYIWRIVSSDL